ncbi:hypothetical protein HY490_02655 [Candidatus Woesearchaeota archaeon]|nr:hypothetical protein [Candidatus Woesearchaeota archaeon]
MPKGNTWHCPPVGKIELGQAAFKKLSSTRNECITFLSVRMKKIPLSQQGPERYNYELLHAEWEKNVKRKGITWFEFLEMKKGE